MYDVTDNRETNNYNTHIAQYLKKWMQPGNEIWSINRINMRNNFLEKSYIKCGEEASLPRYTKNKVLTTYFDLT